VTRPAAGPAGSQDSGGPAEALGERRHGIHADIAIAGGIVAFCGLVYALTLTFPTVPAALATGMGPEAFPRLLLGLLVFLAGLLAFLTRGKKDEVREPIPAMVYWTALAMLAFMGVLWLGGMVAAMLIGFVGMGLLWGERRWPLLVSVGIALSGVIYVLFVKGFAIPLPRGLIGDWLL
jgi:putative tricarboxylic transport membrane protein